MSTRRACSLAETVTRSLGWGPAETKEIRSIAAKKRKRYAAAMRMRMVSCGLQLRSNVFRHNIRCAIATTQETDRKSTRLNSSHGYISYAVFCLKKKYATALCSACGTHWHRHSL